MKSVAVWPECVNGRERARTGSSQPLTQVSASFQKVVISGGVYVLPVEMDMDANRNPLYPLVLVVNSLEPGRG